MKTHLFSILVTCFFTTNQLTYALRSSSSFATNESIRKECSCLEIHMKRTTCARAYLKGGCNVCNPSYFELTGADVYIDSDAIITDIKVREGCVLVIYKYGEHEGELTKLEGGNTAEEFNRKIGSYECSCNSSYFIAKPTPSPTQNLLPMLDVPQTIDEVSSMILGEYGRHPGLMAALTSLKNRRSSKNAYILLLGATGSGKSTTINSLFDNWNLTRVGGYESTTTDIQEFRIPVNLDELGINNAELRMIDTPGLLDTRGLEQDARFLATLDEYLANHEELSTRLPTVVLIFHKFTDNRYDGLGSNFIKVLRVLESMRTRIIDETYSNAVFVFSHFGGENTKIQKYPTSKLRRFKSVIETYTRFPKPVVLTVAENKGNHNYFPMVNGYYTLPNGEFYPWNLFEKIDRVTFNCGDPIGNAVIRSAFKDSENFNTSSVQFPLVSSDHERVSKYSRILDDAAIIMEETEVSRGLSQAHTLMDPELIKKYPTTLSALQQSLYTRNIKTRKDVPVTDVEIIELLSSLNQNRAVLFLLRTGLGMNILEFPHPIAAGHSFSLLSDAVLPTSPFKLSEGINSDIGYLFPSSVSCVVINHMYDHMSISYSEQDYLLGRLKSLSVCGTIPVGKFTGRPQTGFNVQNLNGSQCELTALREFRNFKLVLNGKLNRNFKLTEEFNSTLRSLPGFNESDRANVQKWTSFLNEFGTHIVRQVYGGGSIEIQIRSNYSCERTLAYDIFQFIQFAEDVTLIRDSTVMNTLNAEGITHKLVFHGGDPAFHTHDLTSMSLEEASTLLKNWRKSLKVNSIILTTKMDLLSISEMVNFWEPNISSEIQKATSFLYKSSFTASECKFDNPDSSDLLYGAKLLPRNEISNILEQSPFPEVKKTSEYKFNVTLSLNSPTLSSTMPPEVDTLSKSNDSGTQSFIMLLENLREESIGSIERFQQYQRLLVSMRETLMRCDKIRGIMLIEVMELLILQHQMRKDRAQREHENFIKQHQLGTTKNTQAEESHVKFVERLRKEFRGSIERFQQYRRLLVSMRKSTTTCEKPRASILIELMENLILQHRMANEREQRENERLKKMQ